MIGRRIFLQGCGTGIAAASGLSLPFFSSGLRAQGAGIAVRGAFSAPGFTFAGLYIAKARGLWAKNGVDPKLTQVQGGALAMVSLTNNEADFISVASTDPMIGWDKGVKTLVVAAYTGALAMQFTARKDWMSKTGISPKSPLEDRVKALKGARIGASSVGGGPTQYTKFLGSLFGIDPERELKILAVGFGPSRIAALRENQVDVTVGDAPEADQIALEGFGELFLNCATDVPLFASFPYTVLAVTPEFADKQPDTVRRVAQTIGQANDMVQNNFGDVVDILKAEFPKIDPKAIELSMERDKAAFPRGARMSATMWENGVKVASAMKTVKNPPPAQEGEFWTNKFL